MANLRVATATRQAQCDAVVDLIDGGAGAGRILIYDGTQPANANINVTDQVLLAELTFSDPAFGAADSNGIATANAITQDASANNTGTATWARIIQSVASPEVVVFDCDVGTSGATINLNTTSIVAGGAVSITSFTITQPDGA